MRKTLQGFIAITLIIIGFFFGLNSQYYHDIETPNSARFDLVNDSTLILYERTHYFDLTPAKSVWHGHYNKGVFITQYCNVGIASEENLLFVWEDHTSVYKK